MCSRVRWSWRRTNLEKVDSGMRSTSVARDDARTPTLKTAARALPWPQTGAVPKVDRVRRERCRPTITHFDTEIWSPQWNTVRICVQALWAPRRPMLTCTRSDEQQGKHCCHNSLDVYPRCFIADPAAAPKPSALTLASQELAPCISRATANTVDDTHSLLLRRPIWWSKQESVLERAETSLPVRDDALLEPHNRHAVTRLDSEGVVVRRRFSSPLTKSHPRHRRALL